MIIARRNETGLLVSSRNIYEDSLYRPHASRTLELYKLTIEIGGHDVCVRNTTSPGIYFCTTFSQA